jgi:hypothetical protein
LDDLPQDNKIADGVMNKKNLGEKRTCVCKRLATSRVQEQEGVVVWRIETLMNMYICIKKDEQD